jgi:hypothetical protein
VTFNFDAGTMLQLGDWWYMDLPEGTFLCNSIDYFIAGGGVANGAGTITISNNAALYNVVGAGAVAPVPPIAPGASNGPITVTDLGGGAPQGGVGGLVYRVTAAANTQRVWMYVYGGVGGTMTVGAGTTYGITIVDGLMYQNAIILNSNAGVATSTPFQINTWGDGTVANPFADTMHGNTPHPQNTLCVNAEQMAGSLMFVSFDSKANFITFTGDAQIAHVASANPLSLGFCKGDTTGDILIASQGGCTFDFETPVGGPLGYCPTPPAGTATFRGNRLLIQGATTFGDPGDRYDLRVFSDTPGVYLSAGPALTGFTPAATTECTGNGTAIPVAWRFYNDAGTPNATPATAPGSCSVPSANRTREARTVNGAIVNIHPFDTMFVNLPNLVYDTNVIGDQTAAVIRFSLHKYPCGEIFTTSHTIGTFVTTCPVVAATPGTNLLFPFLPAMDGVSHPGWWGGFMIVNASTAAGTATLTFTESDGDTATYTTPSIPAGGQFTAASSTELLAMVTEGATNPGTFGDSNVSVVAVCTFNLGAGFCFTGNGEEGTGYTSKVLVGGVYQ